MFAEIEFSAAVGAWAGFFPGLEDLDDVHFLLAPKE